MTEIELKEELLNISDKRPIDQIFRERFVAETEIRYNQFYEHIRRHVKDLGTKKELEIDQNFLNYFFAKFEVAFKRWKQFLTSMGKLPDYIDILNDLFYLGLWDADYSNDPKEEKSPFGRLLSKLQKITKNRKIGIIDAANQQLNHMHKENLVNAQKFVNEMYTHFRNFVYSNGLEYLKPDYVYPPIVQLCAGGAATFLKEFPVPTIIAIDQEKANSFSGFSALPHEFGHDLSGTFKSTVLVKEIKKCIKNLNLKHDRLWQMWIEECFADAIGVCLIKEGEIYSLANLFSNFYTNIIFKDKEGNKEDEHPANHIRVLLAIEVGRLLDLDKDFLNTIEKEWIAFSKRINKICVINEDEDSQKDVIYNQLENLTYPMEDFVEAVKPVAIALVKTPYAKIAHKTVEEIFTNFESDLAKRMICSIKKTEKKWLRLERTNKEKV
jgi:hypothetical protein